MQGHRIVVDNETQTPRLHEACWENQDAADHDWPWWVPRSVSQNSLASLWYSSSNENYEAGELKEDKRCAKYTRIN
jgi:hypothetical protein